MTRRKDPPRPIGQTIVTLACIHCGAVILRRAGHHSRNVRLRRDGPFCSKHCATLHHPTVPQPFDPEAFWARVSQPSATECWEWQGARQPKGYGNLLAGGRHSTAHRVAYELAKGPIPAGMMVMHACDNPPCCNPAHLSIGTAGDNIRDMHAKGRDPASKLTEEAVRSIRAQAGSRSLLSLGHEFGVHPKTIRRVIDGEGWRHVV